MNGDSNPEFAACVERRRAACGMTRAQLARLVRGRDRPEKEEVASIREEVLSAEVARRAAALVAAFGCLRRLCGGVWGSLSWRRQ